MSYLRAKLSYLSLKLKHGPIYVMGLLRSFSVTGYGSNL